MRYKSCGSIYDRMFSKISSGRSFIVIGSLAISDVSEHVDFLLLYETDADAVCT
jgi:hypothetical protein